MCCIFQKTRMNKLRPQRQQMESVSWLSSPSGYSATGSNFVNNSLFNRNGVGVVYSTMIQSSSHHQPYEQSNEMNFGTNNNLYDQLSEFMSTNNHLDVTTDSVSSVYQLSPGHQLQPDTSDGNVLAREIFENLDIVGSFDANNQFLADPIMTSLTCTQISSDSDSSGLSHMREDLSNDIWYVLIHV